jgi:hypothetical protein
LIIHNIQKNNLAEESNLHPVLIEIKLSCYETLYLQGFQKIKEKFKKTTTSKAANMVLSFEYSIQRKLNI